MKGADCITPKEWAEAHPEILAEFDADTPLQANQPRTALEIRQQEQKNAENQALAVYKAYQANIKATEMLRTEILKDLQNVEPLACLFLKAVKALSLCVNSGFEYDIIENTLFSVYGASGDAEVCAIAAEQVRKRLVRLNNALQTADNENDRIRIQQAIQAHQKKLAGLETNNGT